MSITEYIAASFDSRYRKIEKLNMKLRNLKYWRSSYSENIGKEEKMLVLTGMNYAYKETLYEEAKTSLIENY